MHDLLRDIKGIVNRTGLFSYDDEEDVMSTIGCIENDMPSVSIAPAISQIERAVGDMRPVLEQILNHTGTVSLGQRDELAFLEKRLKDTVKALKFLTSF